MKNSLPTMSHIEPRFLAPQQEVDGLSGRTKSSQAIDKTGTERLQAGLGRPLVADTLLSPPLSDPDKSGGGLRH